ncbi:hypothetical protein B0T16DRAFT_43609 [Cercophora newfieldiana]|uniref:Uncharacterized protein n=1 Tax=Cercophora newfieldiana TaxID=92897 RepID=A0AA39YRQ3_9PEZI|nr:hypothetical protein B0T16DRAFT_43609 [Cercophora newfieldiana]
MKSYAQALRGNKKAAQQPKAPVAEHKEASSSAAETKTTKANPAVATGNGVTPASPSLKGKSTVTKDAVMSSSSNGTNGKTPSSPSLKGKDTVTREAAVSASSNGTNGKAAAGTVDSKTSPQADPKGKGIATEETDVSSRDDVKGKAVATATTGFEKTSASGHKEKPLVVSGSFAHVETKPAVTTKETQTNRKPLVVSGSFVHVETKSAAAIQETDKNHLTKSSQDDSSVAAHVHPTQDTSKTQTEQAKNGDSALETRQT